MANDKPNGSSRGTALSHYLIGIYWLFFRSVDMPTTSLPSFRTIWLFHMADPLSACSKE